MRKVFNSAWDAWEYGKKHYLRPRVWSVDGRYGKKWYTKEAYE